MNAKKLVAAWRAKFPRIAEAWSDWLNAPYVAAADELSDMYLKLHGKPAKPLSVADILQEKIQMRAEELRKEFDGRTFQVGDRVKVSSRAGFSARSHGVITKVQRPSGENCAQAAVDQAEVTIYWVLRDGAVAPVMFSPWELMPELDRPNDPDPIAKAYPPDVYSRGVWHLLKNQDGHTIGAHWHERERQPSMPKEMGMPYGVKPKDVFPDVPDGLENWAMAARIACCSDPCYTVCHGDLTECRTCEQRWDTNDQCPPLCPYAHHKREPK